MEKSKDFRLKHPDCRSRMEQVDCRSRMGRVDCRSRMERVVKYLPLVFVTFYSLSGLTPCKGSPASAKNLRLTIDRKEVVEGGNLTVVCNVSAQGSVYWTYNGRTVEFGKTLNIPGVTRNLSGLYTCSAFNNSIAEDKTGQNLQQEIYTFFLDVLYPANILSVNISTTELHAHDNFSMQVTVEGNPYPTTMFKSLVDGTTWFLKENSEGTFKINFLSVNCTDTGLYELTCTNKLANKSVIENITVLCPPEPDPRFPLNKTVKPRVDDTVEITVHVVGYPAPSYQWWYNGTQTFNHTDIANTTMLTLHNIAAENFGPYDLRMKNEAGNSSITFEIKADGPPDPVTGLDIFSNSTNTAYISFVTGFDYNDTQTFYIMRDLNGNLTDFNRKIMDSPGDNGGKHVSFVIGNLTDSTDYTLTVLSGNSRANSSHLPDAVNFSTFGKPKPDPDFPPKTQYKPRLGDRVVLTIHAKGNPNPEFYWSHNGKTVNSTDTDYNSSVVLENIDVDDFGTYVLNITNRVGSYTLKYKILADGPPESVSNLTVDVINRTCAHVSFTTGYNYNRTQTFIIERYVEEKLSVLENFTDLTSGRGGELFTCILCRLKEGTIYNVTVVSENSAGESPPAAKPFSFTTYGKPKPDPSHSVNSTFKPRLGESVTLCIHAVGYPAPTYQWIHEGVKVNSTDSSYYSQVHIENVTVGDFGEYVLTMQNKEGNFTEVYEIKADGPPAPASNLEASSITVSSVNINFLTGYDYNKTQAFIVMRAQNGRLTELKSVNDSFPDRGQKTFSINVTALASNTVYNITVVSKNSNGASSSSISNYISFTTEGLPSPDPAHPVNSTAKPRLGADAILKMYAIGNPRPEFSWWHNNSPLIHTDDGLTTMIAIHSVTKYDFGQYVLNMRNDIGVYNYTFNLVEDGPPDAVTQFNFSKVTSDTVTLSWKAGFDYGNKQTFEVRGTMNNYNYTNPEQIDDSTGGEGGMVAYTLQNLESSASYAIYITAKNSKGTASKSNTISFKTQAGPKKNKTTAAEYVGYVMGSVGGVVFIIVIVVVIRQCRRTGNEANYEELHEEEDPPHQPHHYSYDDAAVPSGS